MPAERRKYYPIRHSLCLLYRPQCNPHLSPVWMSTQGTLFFCLHCSLLSCIFPCTEPSGLSSLHDPTAQSPVTITAVYLFASVAFIKWNLAHTLSTFGSFSSFLPRQLPEKRFGWRCSETSWGRISWCGADSEFWPFIDKPSGVSVIAAGNKQQQLC